MIDNLNSKILYLNNKNINDLRFQEILSLKSGFDKFSKMKFEELSNGLSNKTLICLQDIFKNDNTYVLKTLRWFHRGLSLPLAIRKIKTKLIVLENINLKKKFKHNLIFVLL